MIATQHPGGCCQFGCAELGFLLLPISLASLPLTTLAFLLFLDRDQLLTASERISPSSHPQFFLSCLFLLVLSVAQLKCHCFQSLSQLLNLRLSFLISKHFLFQIQEEASPPPLALIVSQRRRSEGTDLFALFTRT